MLYNIDAKSILSENYINVNSTLAIIDGSGIVDLHVTKYGICQTSFRAFGEEYPSQWMTRNVCKIFKGTDVRVSELFWH